jgi:murein L,D-transpeptidase YafK
MGLLLAVLVCLILSPGAPAATADRVVVLKADRTMTLYRGEQALKTYKIALGRNPVGPKEQEGDGRTPEGVYAIDGRNPQSAFHRSLHVSYPNADDRRRAERLHVRPGGAIMIHGLPNGYGALGAAHRLHDWTDGCIAVTDDEIEEIWRMVPNGARVEIRP